MELPVLQHLLVLQQFIVDKFRAISETCVLLHSVLCCVNWFCVVFLSMTDFELVMRFYSQTHFVLFLSPSSPHPSLSIVSLLAAVNIKYAGFEIYTRNSLIKLCDMKITFRYPCLHPCMYAVLCTHTHMSLGVDFER